MFAMHYQQVFNVPQQSFCELGGMTMLAKVCKDFLLIGHMAFAIANMALGHLLLCLSFDHRTYIHWCCSD